MKIKLKLYNRGPHVNKGKLKQNVLDSLTSVNKYHSSPSLAAK